MIPDPFAPRKRRRHRRRAIFLIRNSRACCRWRFPVEPPGRSATPHTDKFIDSLIVTDHLDVYVIFRWHQFKIRRRHHLATCVSTDGGGLINIRQHSHVVYVGGDPLLYANVMQFSWFMEGDRRQITLCIGKDNISVG